MSMESGSHPRLRTAYDREVMAGRAPWVPGGNPTPEESARQATYDAGRPLVDLSANPDPSEYADQVPTGTGSTVSGVLAARGDRGWEADADRDSAMAARLAEYVRHLDDLARKWTKQEGSFSTPYPDQADFVDMINDFTDTWQAIRKITRGEGGR